MLTAAIPKPPAIHAFTAGAIGIIVLGCDDASGAGICGPV